MQGNWGFVAALYALAINTVTFALFGADKKRAVAHEYRIAEKTLLLLCGVGGSLGGLVAMRVFRHKTKHAAFVYGVPGLLFLNVFCYLLLFGR